MSSPTSTCFLRLLYFFFIFVLRLFQLHFQFLLFPVDFPVVECLTEEYTRPDFCDVVQCLTEEYTRYGQRNRKIADLCDVVQCLTEEYTSLMARIPDKIKTIDGSKETLKFAVRITDLWFVGVADKSGQAEMVMVDSNGDEIHAVYIIGVVDEVVFCHVSSRSSRVVFKLRDLSDQLLSCTLWDDYCLQFLEYLDEHESESPIIVLLTNARIKEGQGSYPPSVSNSLKASKLAINELVVQIQEFNQRLSKLGIEVQSVLARCGQGSSQLSDESTRFLIWDRECIELIGQSADEVNCLKIADGDLDLNASLEALDKLLGNVLAFKIKQSISIKSYHDPLIGLPLTPTKRQPSHECDDEARSSQISPA
ncbi:hypothetical protein JHK82_034126 [Glycine max]|nr:hypothetical protein JHK85_034839 [Glycine max]KAG4986504.1 hypothetical protein JHK86_034195 [Glycine max]KAG5119706.1 hypothetical protein JHK82_034126 [Glycine max]